MRLIVTRPRQEANRWVESLQQHGLEAVALPLITIAPAGGNDAAAVQNAWNRLADFDGVMFVSSNAVEHFFALKPENKACHATNVIALATGPGTVSALHRMGVPADRIRAPQHDAGQFDSEALWGIVASQVRAGFRMLVVRGGEGRNWFSEQVMAAGGTVEFVTSYQRKPPHFSAEERAWVTASATSATASGAMWLFSSSEAVANLVAAFPQQSWALAQAIATHPRIAHAARAAGFGNVQESRPTLADLVAAIHGN